MNPNQSAQSAPAPLGPVVSGVPRNRLIFGLLAGNLVVGLACVLWISRGSGQANNFTAGMVMLGYLAVSSLVLWMAAGTRTPDGGSGTCNDGAAQPDCCNDRLARLHITLGRINQCIAKCQGRDDLFREVCAVMVETCGFKTAMISEVVGAEGDLTLSTCQILAEDGTARRIPGQPACGFCTECARSGRPVYSDTKCADPKIGCCQDPNLVASGFCVAYPLNSGGRVAAVLNVCAPDAGRIEGQERLVLEKISEDLSFALDRLADQESRRSAEDALESNATLLHMMGRTANVGGWELDPATGKGEWTDEVARIHDLPPTTQPSAEMGFSFYRGESEKIIREAVGQAIAHGTPYDLELEIVSATGIPKWVRTICMPEVENGRVIKLRGSVQDITERKNARIEIERQTGLIRSLLDSIPDLVFVKDLKGAYTSCNPAFAALVGKPIHGIEGKTDHELFPAEVADAFRKDDLRTIESLSMQSIEEWVVHPDGHRVMLDTVKTPYRGPDGTLLGVLGISRDITERKRVEDRLRESELRFRALVEAAPEAIFVRTGDRFSYLNAAAAKLLGADSPDRLLGMRVLERFHPDCREIVGRRMGGLDDSGEATHEADRVMLRLDGTAVDASISAVPIIYQGLPGALVFARDISDRKRAEQALRRQLDLRDQLGRIASTVPGTIFSFRLAPDGSVSVPFASAALERICGLRPKDLRDDASRMVDRVHPDDLRRIRESVDIPAGKPNPLQCEFRIQDRNGEYVWLEGRAVPRNESDGVVIWHGFLMDITERKQTEGQLRQLSRAVEQSPVTVVITDPAGNIEYVNPKFTELTGYTREEAIGLNPRILKSGKTPPEDYDRLWRTITAGGTWRGEFLNRKKSGEEFHEFASITPITGDDGKITHYLAVKEDITESKELEARFRQSQKLEGVGQLAGGVAHDFNNILASMMIQAELSSMVEGTPPAVTEGLNQIRSAMERAAGLTRQLLLFSRKQVLQPRILDLNGIVTGLAGLLERVIREDVNMRVHLHPEPLMTRADAGMLDQVLMNLAVNSQDAMPKGGRLVIETAERTFDEESARFLPDAMPGRYVCLCVSDTGRGMTPEVKARIFEPFFTTKEPGKGTGLGLSTVFGIVKQHGGWINVCSETDQGSCFQVYLPVCDELPDAGKHSNKTLPRGGGETILLVEDEVSVRKATRTLFERQGYTVVEAANGRNALRVWKEHGNDVDVLLSDLVMPGGINGRQLADSLRKERPDLKVIFTSGYSPETTNEGNLPGMTDPFLQKPCPPAVLLETVRRTLDEDLGESGSPEATGD